MTEQKPTIEGKMKTCGGPGMCPACQSLESTLVETRRALDIARAAYAKAVERYTEVRADSERGDAFIADRNRTVAQLQADLEAERGKVRKLREALLAAKVMWERGPSPRKLDEALSWRANDEKVNQMVADALSETAPDARSEKEAYHD